MTDPEEFEQWLEQSEWDDHNSDEPTEEEMEEQQDREDDSWLLYQSYQW